MKSTSKRIPRRLRTFLRPSVWMGWSLIAVLANIGWLAVHSTVQAAGNVVAEASEGGSQIFASSEYRNVLNVGPSRRLKVPSQAAKIVTDGTVVEIDAGTYRDCAVWRQNDLLLKAVGGMVHLTGSLCARKAIWVISGTRITVDGIRFSHALDPHEPVSGIRHQGGSLIVRRSQFDNNETGILTYNKSHSELEVYDSIFDHNGNCPAFCGHGVYAGFIARLKVVRSQFRDHQFGHHIKSRARYSEIVGNTIEDGPTGTASYSIDLPNSGTALVRGNFLQKGQRSDNNAAMIFIGGEALNNANQPTEHMNQSRGIVIRDNKFSNLMQRPTNFVWNRSPHGVVLTGNKFSGEGVELLGPGATK